MHWDVYSIEKLMWIWDDQSSKPQIMPNFRKVKIYQSSDLYLLIYNVQNLLLCVSDNDPRSTEMLAGRLLTLIKIFNSNDFQVIVVGDNTQLGYSTRKICCTISMGLPQQKNEDGGGKSMDIRNAFKLSNSAKKTRSVSKEEIEVISLIDDDDSNTSKEISSLDKHSNAVLDDSDPNYKRSCNKSEPSNAIIKHSSPMNHFEGNEISTNKGNSRKRKASEEEMCVRKSLKFVDKIIAKDDSPYQSDILPESKVETSFKEPSNMLEDNDETNQNTSVVDEIVDPHSSDDVKSCDVSCNVSIELSEGDMSKLDESVISMGDNTDEELNSSTCNKSLEMNDDTNIKMSPEGQQAESIDSTKENISKKRKKMSSAEAKLREEKRIEKMQKRQEEKLARDEEKKRLKEAKEKEKLRILKERQIRKEREEMEKKERERLRLEKKEQKELEEQQKQTLKAEEKRKKEEEKAKIAEEKSRLAEEKRLAEEEKKKLQLEKERRTKEAFHNFFVKSGFSQSSSQAPVQETIFKPFQVTDDMTLAPLVPSLALDRFNKKQLDTLMNKQECKLLYLDLLKSEGYKSIHSRIEKNCKIPNEMEDNDVVLVDNSVSTVTHLKAKFLQFCENIRPAYWGTWRKKSKNIRPRNPFGQDNIFDYDVDSEEEWDEGGPGESLTGTEDEESEDDYEVDNKFFVPHGYLSPEEEGEEDEAPTDPDELRSRLKVKEKAFLLERQKKTIELKPIILGCFFETDVQDVKSVADTLLGPYAAELLTSKEVLTAATAYKSLSTESPDAKSHGNSATVPEDAMPYLIKLLHGNTNGRKLIIQEFQAFWKHHCETLAKTDTESEVKENEIPEATDQKVQSSKSTLSNSETTKISKRQLNIMIPKISHWSKNVIGSVKRFCWWVKEDIIKKYSVTDIQLPNQWNYIIVKDS